MTPESKGRRNVDPMRLRKLIKICGFTIMEAAEFLGVASTTLENWLSSDPEKPRAPVMAEIALEFAATKVTQKMGSLMSAHA